MIDILNSATDIEVAQKLDPENPRTNYCISNHDSKPFPGPEILDTIDEEQGIDFRREMYTMMDKAVKSGISSEKLPSLLSTFNQDLCIYLI